MDRDSALPDRCIACNEPAEGHRLRRKLHCSPAAWKVGASLTPFLAFLAATWLDLPKAALAFWPLVIVAVVANLFVRKSLKFEVGVCKRHEEQRFALLAISWLCFGGIFVGAFMHPVFMLLALIGLLVVLALQSLLGGVQALRLADLTREHAWLAGAGEAFRATLPELN